MVLAPREKIEAFTARGWWGVHTLDELFRANVRRDGARTAVVDAINRSDFTEGVPRSLSYQQLDAQVQRLCCVLLQDGLVKDDIVAVQMPNCVEQFVVYLACARLGLIVTPLPTPYREHELSYMLAHTGAHAAITCTRIANHRHARMFAGLKARLGALRTIYAWGPVTDDWPHGVVPLEHRMQELADTALVMDYLERTPISANDVFTICWTSGTEAAPKGVPRSHNEWLVMTPSIIEGSRLNRHCRMLNPFALVNMAGLSVSFASWIVLAGTVVQHQPFDLEIFLQQLRQERIDYTNAAPAILGQLLRNHALVQGIDFKRLATIGSGSSPLSEWLVRGFKERFDVDIVNHFGSNEGASLTSAPTDIPAPETRARYFPRAGVTGFDWTISTTRKISTRLVDLATGEQIDEPGRVGELRYSGATIFSGYYKAPELTAQAFDEQGYYKTGDLFEIGGTGNAFYRHVGRSKDLVIRGGMNISAQEVEDLVLAHPKVREAAVVGYADERLGERACACVVPQDGHTLTLDDLRTFLRDEKRVAAYKLPERLLLVAALPRNPLGKVLKRELREQLNAVASA